ncbi:centromere protein J [Linepithema humile]|uniref:centromere protein J n=1 Tax=Linepithema humile TaxID=83485 RepID=UPI0006237802|nr:PREDICTED: centromere protein J [Linepithema humile]XP_012224199.1 PREDICTED: centromere protein J [Linepithema humile]
MDLEASITKRLQKLKQWQLEQQERLLKQQQMQREILSNEKDRIYKALGLPIHDFNNIIENTEDVCDEIEIDAQETMSHDSPLLQYDARDSDSMLEMSEREMPTNIDTSCEKCEEETEGEEEEKEIEIPNDIATIVENNRNSVKHYNSSILLPKEELSNDLLIEGIKPLSSNNIALHVSIDDIPLPSPKEDFHTLLEEKLKREAEVASNVHAGVMAKPKKPFLKKGQGLSRYKISTNSHLPTTKKHSTLLSLNKERADRTHKSKKSVCKNIVSESPSNVSAAIGRQRLNLKAVSLPRKILNKSESVACNKQVTNNATSDQPKHLSERMSMSDCDSKAERELEEVRIFELLEEKAENSSFCSTSSTVLAFLQQSTPFKIKKTLNYAGSESGVTTSMKQLSDKRRNGTIQQVVQRSAHIENLKSPRRVEQFDVYKRSRTSVAAINSCWETVSDTQKEAQGHLTLNNQDALYNTPIVAELTSDSEEGDVSTANDRSLTRNNDASHHVRFSEYNEYRTIDLIDTSDATNKSSFEDELEQQDSDNNSFLSSESSDVEEKPEDYEEQMSSLTIIDDEKAVDASRRLSLQQDVKDLFYRAMKSEPFSVPEEGNTSSCKNELPDDDTMTEETGQMFNQSILSFSSSSSSSSSSLSGSRQELSVHEKEEYTLKNEKTEKICLNAREDRINTFESELLKSRLLELEKEIDIFRKESATLLLQRRKLQEEQTILRKEYMEKEKNFEENRRRIQNQLEEEKKKLAREKVAMESRIRDAQEKAKQNKMERQTAQDLQEQLENLGDELNIKESRWNAAESRYKSELRVLRVEISKLKQEIANLQNVKKVKNVKNIKKSTNGQVIAKAINQINKRVIAASSSKETSAKISRDLSDTSSGAFIHDENDNNDDDNDKKRNKKSVESKAIDINDDFEQIENRISANKIESKPIDVRVETQPKRIPTGNIAAEKKNLYKNLLKDATSDLVDDQEYHIEQDINNPYQSIVTQMRNVNVPRSNEISGKSSDKSYFASEGLERTTVDDAKNTKCYTERLHEINEDKDRDQVAEKNSNMTLHSPSLHQTGISPKDVAKQIQHSDRCFEYLYPNGNMKKVFPDQGITKMIYYNGDVRETDKDGKVKYFYSASRTWCTMTPDGLQILEFSSGQVEKRTADGTVEVLFPDGAVKIVQADGMEKWSLPDGTAVQIFTNGDKILTLPNGQREIQTKNLKRREYPDGTVKLVYADGSQETRYSSGRKRLKDKDGNLLMDYYDN